MYISIQTVCTCHGFLLFESVHCDRCRSLIPFQLSDESLIDPISTNQTMNEVTVKSIHGNKQAVHTMLSQRKQLQQIQQGVLTGRVRFRATCPFCNTPTYVLRYYCKRERIYYHLRIQNFSENEQSIYKSIADTQTMNKNEFVDMKNDQSDSSLIESMDDSYSLNDSSSQRLPSTVLYDQNGIPNARDTQIENERSLYALNDLQGDLFNVLRNGLYYDTLIQCQDGVKIQAHRCILGGRSSWFRHLLNEHHDTHAQDDYVLQISIDDMNSDVLDEVLNFMYTNRCLISLKNAPDLLLAAKRFEVDKLRKQVAEFLLSRLTVDNAIDLLICAHEAGSDALKLACIRIINRHASKIKRTEKWKHFKKNYVDLVPELYEYRIERPEAVPASLFSDVFTAPAVPSKSLLTLNQLYENPVKQPVVSPTPRVIPQITTKVQEVHQTPYPSHQIQQIPSVVPTIHKTTGSFVQGHTTRQSPVLKPESPVKKTTKPTTRHQNPSGPAAPLTRTVYPTVSHYPEDYAYRRPVKVTEKQFIPQTNHQKQQVTTTRVPQKVPPPPPAPITVSRAVSPKSIIEFQQSPTLTEIPLDERLTLTRVVSAETMD